VSGLVTNTRGDAEKDYWVVLFSRDHEKWESPSRYVRSARPDRDGRFKVSGLPAGEYLALAVAYIEPGQANDPEFLQRAQTGAVGFALNDGETKTLDLKLSLAAVANLSARFPAISSSLC
jgi:hypothetical protein